MNLISDEVRALLKVALDQNEKERQERVAAEVKARAYLKVLMQPIRDRWEQLAGVPLTPLSTTLRDLSRWDEEGLTVHWGKQTFRWYVCQRNVFYHVTDELGVKSPGMYLGSVTYQVDHFTRFVARAATPEALTEPEPVREFTVLASCPLPLSCRYVVRARSAEEAGAIWERDRNAQRDANGYPPDQLERVTAVIDDRT